MLQRGEARPNRPHIGWCHLYEIFRIDKSIESKKRLVVARGWGKGEWQGFLSRWWRSSGTREWWELHNTVNVLNVTEVYTLKWLKWQILCYMYCTINARPVSTVCQERCSAFGTGGNETWLYDLYSPGIQKGRKPSKQSWTQGGLRCKCWEFRGKIDLQAGGREGQGDSFWRRRAICPWGVEPADTERMCD